MNEHPLPAYAVRRVSLAPAMDCDWDSDTWNQADTARIDSFRPESSDHRPRTRLRLLHTGDAVHGMFAVDDRFVRSVRTSFGDMVCKDSCVEVFLQPRLDKGYINFEFNCGGTLLASYITDPTRVPGGFKEFVRLSPDDARLVGVHHTMPAVVDPELVGPVTWRIQFSIRLELFERYTGQLGTLDGQRWRGNFYKCADESSHPHWAAWAPVPRLNFHDPESFGGLQFGAR